MRNFNLTCMLLLSAFSPILLLVKFRAPARQGFLCDDVSIRRPNSEETVTSSMLLFLTSLLPLSIVRVAKIIEFSHFYYWLNISLFFRYLLRKCCMLCARKRKRRMRWRSRTWTVTAPDPHSVSSSTRSAACSCSEQWSQQRRSSPSSFPSVRPRHILFTFTG